MIKVSQLKHDDLDAMIQLQETNKNNALFTPSRREVYEQAFNHQNFVFGLIDEDDNKLIGFCNCSVPAAYNARINLGKGIIPDCELDAVGHVNTILIDREFRGGKYGSRLLKQVIQTFKNKPNVHYIFTTLNPTNEASYHLFSSNGFEEAGHLKGGKLILMKKL